MAKRSARNVTALSGIHGKQAYVYVSFLWHLKTTGLFHLLALAGPSGRGFCKKWGVDECGRGGGRGIAWNVGG